MWIIGTYNIMPIEMDKWTNVLLYIKLADTYNTVNLLFAHSFKADLWWKVTV